MASDRLMNILGPGKIQPEDVAPNWAAIPPVIGNALKSMTEDDQFISDLIGSLITDQNGQQENGQQRRFA